jgi:hypothetical protein
MRIFDNKRAVAAQLVVGHQPAPAADPAARATARATTTAAYSSSSCRARRRNVLTLNSRSLLPRKSLQKQQWWRAPSHASGAAGGVHPTQPIGLEFQIPVAINEVRGPHGQGVVPRLAAGQQALHASVPRPTQNARWGSAQPLKISGERCWKRLDGVVIYVAAQAHIGRPHGAAGSRLSSAYMFTKVSGSPGKFLREFCAAFLRHHSEDCE